MNVLTAAEALAKYADNWPRKIAELDREAQAMRDRMKARQEGYWKDSINA